MRVAIDGSLIRSEFDVHDTLSRALDFGPYYGRNLDALWDRLSADVERPVEIVWVNSDISRAFLGDEVFERIKSVLIKVMHQDESFELDEKLTVSFD